MGSLAVSIDFFDSKCSLCALAVDLQDAGTQPGMAAHPFNPGTQEVEAGGPL